MHGNRVFLRVLGRGIDIRSDAGARGRTKDILDGIAQLVDQGGEVFTSRHIEIAQQHGAVRRQRCIEQGLIGDCPCHDALPSIRRFENHWRAGSIRCGVLSEIVSHMLCSPGK